MWAAAAFSQSPRLKEPSKDSCLTVENRHAFKHRPTLRVGVTSVAGFESGLRTAGHRAGLSLDFVRYNAHGLDAIFGWNRVFPKGFEFRLNQAFPKGYELAVKGDSSMEGNEGEFWHRQKSELASYLGRKIKIARDTSSPLPLRDGSFAEKQTGHQEGWVCRLRVGNSGSSGALPSKAGRWNNIRSISQKGNRKGVPKFTSILRVRCNKRAFRNGAETPYPQCFILQ